MTEQDINQLMERATALRKELRRDWILSMRKSRQAFQRNKIPLTAELKLRWRDPA